ncbi:MAG: rRNA pseudouridine synthase [Myxococcaceae bacterium]|jgi:pseudouridine synthase|nr:rRNA pseudouridine synthase [Myxococcaceae bacterium]MCA3011630.1 rRNA pseudouridine synthase [Myxococcaceae bacterium]
MRRRKEPKWLQAAKARGGASVQADFLSRALARAGVLPPSEAERAIRDGRVTVNGRVATVVVAPLEDSDVVAVDGEPVDVRPTTRVLAFHKPKGLVVDGRDPEGVGTVFERLHALLPPTLRGFGWLAVGRLDRDTTGLLFFTNDERFVAHATDPASKLPKRYVATVSGRISDAKLKVLREGIALDDFTTRPAGAERRGERQVALTLTEGKFHQVKRMLGAVGLATLELHREAVGDYVVDVALDTLRALTDAEVEGLLGYHPRHLG